MVNEKPVPSFYLSDDHPSNLLFGPIAASVVADKFGRRWGAAIGIIIIVIGSVLQALPMVNEAMFLAGRFMVGCGQVTSVVCLHKISSANSWVI